MYKAVKYEFSKLFHKTFLLPYLKQVLLEPSVKQYYFGEEAVFPGVMLKDRYPNCTWKDLYNHLNDPYEGMKKNRYKIYGLQMTFN